MLNNKLPEFASDFVWVNGKFFHLNEAYVHVLTHSLHYAGAVWEGERAYNGKIFKLEGKSVDEEENAKILMQIFR